MYHSLSSCKVLSGSSATHPTHRNPRFALAESLRPFPNKVRFFSAGDSRAPGSAEWELPLLGSGLPGPDNTSRLQVPSLSWYPSTKLAAPRRGSRKKRNTIIVPRRVRVDLDRAKRPVVPGPGYRRTQRGKGWGWFPGPRTLLGTAAPGDDTAFPPHPWLSRFVPAPSLRGTGQPTRCVREFPAGGWERPGSRRTRHVVPPCGAARTPLAGRGMEV